MMMIPTIMINGSNRNPKRGEEISTRNTAIRARKKIAISQILKTLCMQRMDILYGQLNVFIQ
jgi:hypothetical protein